MGDRGDQIRPTQTTPQNKNNQNPKARLRKCTKNRQTTKLGV